MPELALTDQKDAGRSDSGDGDKEKGTQKIDFLKAEGEKIKEEEEREKKVEKVAKELNIVLPKAKGEPLGVRLVALISLLGGLSILGSVVTDIFGDRVSFGLRLARGATGALFLFVSYGLIKKRRWAVWLWAFATLVAIFINPSIAVFLVLIFVYLWTSRGYMKEGPIDEWFEDRFASVREWFGSKFK